MSAPAYWTPSRFVESAWTEHAPFAFWLMDALRPRSVVELGTHLGYSLFVLAEAAKRLGLPTSLIGVDSWEGDEHAGFYGQEVFESVKEIVDRDYSQSIELRRGYFSALAPLFESGSVDLLHIDGRHGYEDVAEDFQLFAPTLSDRAVVIMHDTFEFQAGFGVNRFWAEVSAGFPSFNFEHGHGLGVLAVGAEVPTAVLDFLRRADSDPEGARSAYSRLGAEVSATASMRRLLEERMEVIDTANRLARERDIRIAGLLGENGQLIARVGQLEETVAELRESTSWRVTAPVRAVGAAIGRRRLR